MSLDPFWQVISQQLTELAAAGSAADVLRILATARNPYALLHGRSVTSAPGFFAGSGGDGTVQGALAAAGWRVTWWKASYYYTMTAPDGSSVTYCEGDIYPGPAIGVRGR
jgi:hypothetical protein